MLHDEEDGPTTIDDRIEEAQKCMVKEIRDYADYIKKDRDAVLRACQTRFNNGLRVPSTRPRLLKGECTTERMQMCLGLR